MKVLWISSAAIGPASRILNLPYGGSSGTWIQTEYEKLRAYSNIELFFLCPIPTIKKSSYIKRRTDEGTAYGIGFKPKISFGKRLPKNICQTMEVIIGEIRPDIIQIWGSESSFSATSATLCPTIPKVIYTQGLIGMHQRYMGSMYIREKKYFERMRFLDYLKSKLKMKYYTRHIALEQSAIKSVGNIITDNEFTRAYCESFSLPVFYNHYLYPNKIFYQSVWDYDKVERNTIFTIFAGDPSKGLSQLLKALNIVKRQIPNIKLYVPGPFAITQSGKLDKKRCYGFSRWLYNYINCNNLTDNVVFTGRLDSYEMRYRYLSCNVFVSPSCMEVQSTSVRESMAVGAPTISSLCGSIIEYINHGIDGLIYRFEEEELLAFYILKVLQNSEFAKMLGANAHRKMDVDDSQAQLTEIYKKILMQS